MAKVNPNGSIEVDVSSKIAIFTKGSARIFYRTVEGGPIPSYYYYSSTVSGDEVVLTPGSGVDKVRIDPDGSYPAFYVTGTAATITNPEFIAIDRVYTITIAAAAGGTNESDVTITFKDVNGDAITDNINFEWFLSDAATGLGITGTSASGTVQAKSGEGTDLSVLTAKKHTISQTKNAVGTYVLEITDSAKTAFYVCVKNPVTGVIVPSAVLATGDYG